MHLILVSAVLLFCSCTPVITHYVKPQIEKTHRGTGEQCTLPESSEIFKQLYCEGDKTGAGRCDSTVNVPSHSIYSVTCPQSLSFARNTEEVKVVCYNGSWIPPLEEFKCQATCHLPKSKSLEFSCSYQGIKVECTELLKQDTQISIRCRPHYKKDPLRTYSSGTTCRKDGELQHILNECKPVRGKEFSDKATTLIPEGSGVKYSKYPWHVTLYRKSPSQRYQYHCGATLIDTNKALTAGNCVWDENIRTTKPAEEFAVALGKYYKNWYTTNPWEQKIQVKDVIVRDGYNGSLSKYSNDVAVLILQHHVELSDYVMPICLDLNNVTKTIPENQPVNIIGWDNGKQDKGGSTLTERKMILLDRHSCGTKFNNTVLGSFLLPDKFCALYKNGNRILEGNEGNGMTLVRGNLHYLYGVASIVPVGGIVALFTNVTEHEPWFRNIMDS